MFCQTRLGCYFFLCMSISAVYGSFVVLDPEVLVNFVLLYCITMSMNYLICYFHKNLCSAGYSVPLALRQRPQSCLLKFVNDKILHWKGIQDVCCVYRYI